MAIKSSNIPVDLETFLRIFGLLDLDIQRSSNKKWNEFLSRMWTIFWFLLNVQSFFYYFVTMALPDFNEAFQGNVKGVRSQMSCLAAFLAHTIRAATGLTCHLILILTLRGAFHQLEGLVQIDRNRPEFRRWSKTVIVCILTSV